jgi:hypothetical protein
MVISISLLLLAYNNPLTLNLEVIIMTTDYQKLFEKSTELIVPSELSTQELFEKSQVFPKPSSTLLLIRGLPGSGKTTLTNILLSLNDRSVAYAADDWMHDCVDVTSDHSSCGEYEFSPSMLTKCHELCQESVRKALGDFGPRLVIVHNTFTQDWEMEPYIRMAELFDPCGYEPYDVELFTIVMENRHDSCSIHNVPEEAMDRMYKNLKDSIQLI